MRTKKSFINLITNYVSQIIIIALGFISRRVLIYSVGVEYLGINGLMTNLLTIFSLAESGIGVAIGFSLYEPLAKNDIEKIKSLMKFYKTSYIALALLTALIGLIFFPFLPLFLKGNTTPNTNLIYLLFLFSSVCSYLFSYKVTLNNSDQNKYLFTIVNTVSQILVLIVKVLILYFTENYILFLCVDIFTTLLKNIIFSKIVDKKYPYLKERDVRPLDSVTKNKLFKSIKALFIGKIGYIISQSSDNLVISSIVNITSVGLYSNYTTLVNSVLGFIKAFTSSVSASVGNLLVSESVEKSYEVFKKIDFINYWFYSFSSVCLLCLIEPFISIWLGEQFILDKSILIVTVLMYYLRGINSSTDMVKSAAGLFHQDRYIPILEAIVNMGISIVLAREIGLLGVLIGTLISFLLFSFWIKPFLVFKHIFKRKSRTYFMEILKKFSTTLLVTIICYIVSLFCIISRNTIFNFVLQAIVVFSLVNCLLVLLFYKNKEFKFVIGLIKQKMEGIRK